MAKHRKPTPYGGTTPRGPARWARAAMNALENPNSAAAKLYLDRASRAHRLRTEYPNTEGPFAHPKLEWAPRGTPRVQIGVDYYTCSLYCCTMVVQLDNAIKDYDALLDFMSWRGADEGCPKRATPSRKVRCQCCGADIKP